MSYIQPSISHDAQTTKLGSFFCSNYTAMKQRSNPSLRLLCFQLFIFLTIVLPFSCSYSVAAKSAAVPFTMSLIHCASQSSQLLEPVSMAPTVVISRCTTRWFIMALWIGCKSQGFGSRVATGVASRGRGQGCFVPHTVDSRALHNGRTTGQS